MIYDMVIQNGTIVAVDNDFNIIDKGFVGVSGDTITCIGNAGKQSVPRAKRIIDAGGGIILPGLVNTHNHLPMTLFRGLADDLPLMDWLNDHIFPAEARLITRETARLGALLGCAEMLLSGTTTCCDAYFFEDGVAEALLEIGMRGVLGHGVIDYPAPGVSDPTDNVAAAKRFVERWAGASPLISPSICCHSIYTCSKKTLIHSKEAARDFGVLFQIHAAETRAERRQCASEHGVSPVGFLKELNILDSKTLLAHCVWTDTRDVEAIAESGAAVSVNTESNMKLASGIAPVQRFLSAGIRAGLGTDGCASNNDLDMFKEMDTTAKLHKVHTHDPTVMDAGTVLKLATRGGAAALGLADRIGSIEIGKQADIVVLDTAKPHLTPMFHPVSHIVYAAAGSDVKDVIVGGKQVVKDHGLLTVDAAGIMAEARSCAKSVLKI